MGCDSNARLYGEEHERQGWPVAKGPQGRYPHPARSCVHDCPPWRLRALHDSQTLKSGAPRGPPAMWASGLRSEPFAGPLPALRPILIGRSSRCAKPVELHVRAPVRAAPDARISLVVMVLAGDENVLVGDKRLDLQIEMFRRNCDVPTLRVHAAGRGSPRTERSDRKVARPKLSGLAVLVGIRADDELGA